MMREIKFRAWDGERLRSVWSIGWIDEEMDYLSTPKFNGPAEEFTIMQFTGLTDKNGVEIYEGDILAFEDENYKWSVSYEYASFIAVGGEGNPSELLVEFYDWSTERLDVVVIGNIYENAHLLNETEG